MTFRRAAFRQEVGRILAESGQAPSRAEVVRLSVVLMLMGSRRIDGHAADGIARGGRG